jgi:hypothetical protein
VGSTPNRNRTCTLNWGRDFKRIFGLTLLTISIWLRYSRSLFTSYENLLLRKLISQVVSTPSSNLLQAWHALHIIFKVVILQPFSTVLFSWIFLFKEGLYYIIVSPSCLPIPPSRPLLEDFCQFYILTLKLTKKRLVHIYHQWT